MSRPNALPVGPTRLAESSTSMPPPEPRSSTVSPALSCANAVGLPQPSDARSAFSGTSPAWSASYRFDVMGSHPATLAGAPPQQELAAPCDQRAAASPYLAFTTSLTSTSVLIFISKGSTAADDRLRFNGLV